MFERYADYEYWLASGQLALAMLAMGALLTPRDFVRVLLQPGALLLGLALQLCLVPLLAWGIGRALPLEAGVAAGLVLVAAVPGGTISNLITYLGRGNLALSISLTSITSVACLATTPLILRLFVGAHLPAEFEMPVARVAREIATTLLLPLSTGMLLGWRFPDWREAISRWGVRASLTLIGVMVVGAAGSGRLDPSLYGPLGPASTLLLCFGIQQIAMGVCRAAGLAGPDRLAIGVEVTVRNTNLAIMLKASLFPAVAGRLDPIGDGMLFVALVYGGVALFVAAPPVVLHRRRTPAAALYPAPSGGDA